VNVTSAIKKVKLQDLFALELSRSVELISVLQLQKCLMCMLH